MQVAAVGWAIGATAWLDLPPPPGRGIPHTGVGIDCSRDRRRVRLPVGRSQDCPRQTAYVGQAAELADSAEVDPAGLGLRDGDPRMACPL